MRIIRNQKGDFTAKRNWLEVEFDSVADFAAYGQTACDIPDAERSSLNADGGEAWDYGIGYQGALELVGAGWPQGAEKMRTLADAMYEQIAPQVTVWQETEHAVSGACVNVGAYLTGAPECMLEFKPTEKAGAQPVDLLVSFSYAAIMDADTICNRGAAILAAVDALEHRGCTVSVIAESTSYGCTKSTGARYDVTYRVVLKRQGEVLDVDALAFALMHPAFCRRLEFAALEHAPKRYRQVLGVGAASRYGKATEYPMPDNSVYIEPIKRSNSAGFSTPDSAAEVILAALRSTGLFVESDRVNTC